MITLKMMKLPSLESTRLGHVHAAAMDWMAHGLPKLVLTTEIMPTDVVSGGSSADHEKKTHGAAAPKHAL